MPTPPPDYSNTKKYAVVPLPNGKDRDANLALFGLSPHAAEEILSWWASSSPEPIETLMQKLTDWEFRLFLAPYEAEMLEEELETAGMWDSYVTEEKVKETFPALSEIFLSERQADPLLEPVPFSRCNFSASEDSMTITCQEIHSKKWITVPFQRSTLLTALSPVASPASLSIPHFRFH